MTLFDNNIDRRQAFYKGLDSLSDKQASYLSLPFFSDDEIAALIAATSDIPFRPAKPVVGNNVHQDMEVCFPAPRRDVFDDCATLLEGLVNNWPQHDSFIGRDFILNDFAVQRYGAHSDGIGIHKDGLRYKYLVFIITLSGNSRLFHTTDRTGETRTAIDDTPGRLVMLKAPDFAGFDSDARPLHGVDCITTGRLSIGFRCELLV